MHQIGVVGLSYRHAGIEDVARFAVPRLQLAERLPALRAALPAAELLYLGTCNRVEVIYTTADGSPAADARVAIFQSLTGRDPGPGEASRVLRAWTGEAAVEHLLLLACGLDSAQTGEREIAAQLRGAWEDARGAQTCGAILDRLIGEALGLSRRVRRLSAGVQTPSLADLAADHALRQPGGPGRVALVGVSPMTRRCAALLHARQVPLLIVNRTPAPAHELAASVAGAALALEELRRHPPALGTVILAAGGGEPLLDASVLERLRRAAGAGRAPLLIDFGVPANVEPDAARDAGLQRIGMDQLVELAQGRRLEQLMRLAPVRAAVDDYLTRLRVELATRALGPRLQQLRENFEAIAANEVERALSGSLRTLDARQRAQLERLGRTVALRLAHLPLAGLRAAAEYASSEAVDAFFTATGSPARGAGASGTRAPRERKRQA
jgi:glutamyl-tRNA reductase